MTRVTCTHLLGPAARTFVAMCLLTTACHKNVTPVAALTTVMVSLSPATIQTGQTAIATATGLDQHGAPISVGAVVWSTGSLSVATVNASGVVTGVAPGQAQIAATSGGGKQGQATLTVTAVPVASVTVTPAAATLVLGATQQLTTTAKDAQGNILTGRIVAWATSNLAVAAVSSSGLVTAQASGTATVSAVVEGVTGTAAITVSTPLAIASVSNTSPLPLTPIQIVTRGLDLNAPVSVQYSNASGFSTTLTAIRVGSDGTVTAPVPLYVDPTSGKTSAGAVSVALIQGSSTSKPVQVTIGDLPSVASYGSQPGQITHAFLQYSAMRIASVIGSLQASSLLPGNNVDVSGEVASLQQLLQSTISARGDYDQVALNANLSYDIGILPNSADLRFDRSSLDMMDRTIGLYLTQLTPIILQAASTSALASRASKGIRLSPTRWFPGTGAFQSVGVAAPSAGGGVRLRLQGGSQFAPVAFATSLTGTLQPVFAVLEAAVNDVGIASVIQTAMAKDPGPLDAAIATAGGASVFFAVLNGSKSALAPALGALSAGLGLVQNFGMEIGDFAAILYASRHGNDPVILQAAQANLTKNAKDARWNTVSTELSLLNPNLGAFGGWIAALLKSDIVQNGIVPGASLLVGGKQFVDNAGGWTQLFAVTGQLANQIRGVFTSNAQGCAELRGATTIANAQGGFLAAQTGVSISPFEVQGSNVTALSDPSGNYDICLPLNSPNTDYTRLTVTAFDPYTFVVLGSFTVNFSAVTTATYTTMPTLSGTCIDGDLDGDDPDCDNLALRRPAPPGALSLHQSSPLTPIRPTRRVPRH
jgi:hypothetical protein